MVTLGPAVPPGCATRLCHQGMNVKSYDLCLVVDLDGVGQARLVQLRSVPSTEIEQMVVY